MFLPAMSAPSRASPAPSHIFRRRRDPARDQAADHSGADVGQDVAELVGRDHHIELLRRHHQLHRKPSTITSSVEVG